MIYIKKGLFRGLMGIPIGVFIGSTISVIIGQFFGSVTMEIITASYLASIVLGFCFGALSIIFSIDHWSMLKQTVVHFIGMLIIFLPISLWAGWVPTEGLSIAIFIAIFIFTYLMIWFAQYWYWKGKVAATNEALKHKR